jgi:hypothetical protein
MLKKAKGYHGLLGACEVDKVTLLTGAPYVLFQLITFLLIPMSLISSLIRQFLFVNLVLPEQIHDRPYVGLSNVPLKMHLSHRGETL